VSHDRSAQLDELKRAQRALVASLPAVAAHPSLWITAVVQLVSLARPGWWRKGARLPVPDERYLLFRMHTAFGADGSPSANDVLTYLRWCRAWPRASA
jgi:hypothetical protein